MLWSQLAEHHGNGQCGTAEMGGETLKNFTTVRFPRAKKPCRFGNPGVSFLGTLTCRNPFLRSAMGLALVGKPRIPNCTLHARAKCSRHHGFILHLQRLRREGVARWEILQALVGRSHPQALFIDPEIVKVIIRVGDLARKTLMVPMWSAWAKPLDVYRYFQERHGQPNRHG